LPARLLQDRVHRAGERVEERQPPRQPVMVVIEFEPPLAGVIADVLAELRGPNRGPCRTLAHTSLARSPWPPRRVIPNGCSVPRAVLAGGMPFPPRRDRDRGSFG